MPSESSRQLLARAENPYIIVQPADLLASAGIGSPSTTILRLGRFTRAHEIGVSFSDRAGGKRSQASIHTTYGEFFFVQFFRYLLINVL